jgi:hypothetical protein
MKQRKKQLLAANAVKEPTTKRRADGYAAKIAPKSISRTRQDIATWKAALKQAENVDNPKRVLLHKLYKDIGIDALLTSQLGKRIRKSSSANFVLKKGDVIDENSTALFKKASWRKKLFRIIVESDFFGATLVEFITDKNGSLKMVVLPRQNIIPEKGLLLFDETATTGIDYRSVKEYETWVLEFGEPDDLGLLNKAVPHVLFKRFAQSCWSELCEIYGIPPRVMKTNTQDPAMLSRSEQMMKDMGAAAWFIIDETEEFEFAKGADTNGDVYNNLIRLCNNELSLLLSGAVIGQDTKNGNESKEKISVEQLEGLIDADKTLIEEYMNSLVLPALYKIGFLPEGLTFTFEASENTEELYTRVIGFLEYFDIDSDWLNEKFGIKIIGKKEPAGKANFQQAPEEE